MSTNKDSVVTPLNPTQEATQEKQASQEGYLMRDLIALDMLGNTLTGGKNDETISTRAARLAYSGKGIGKAYGVVMSRFLNFFQKNHGSKAAAGDLIRAKTIVALEENSGLLPKEGK